jgi:DNA repair protein SbcD/Mre11
MIEEALAGTAMEIRRITNKRLVERVLGHLSRDETLEELDVMDVFCRLLDARQVDESERPSLIAAYKETLTSLHEMDINAG